MIEYFRENESSRKTFLWIITILLCAGFGLNQHNNRNSFQIGKRHVNTEYIQYQLANTQTESPEHHKHLQESLIQQQVKHLNHAAQLENLGLKPSIQMMQKKITEQFGSKQAFSRYIEQSKTSKNQAMLRLSDQIAQQQFYDAILQSNIEPPKDQFLAEHSASQTRHGILINLSEAEYTLSPAEQNDLYQRHKHSLISPPEYQYQYIDLSLSSLNISKPPEQLINNYFNEHVDEYTDFDISYTLTTLQPHKKGSSFKIQLNGPSNDLINSYLEQHPKIKSTVLKKHNIRSKIDPKLQSKLERLAVNESLAYIKNNNLIIVTLDSKKPTQSLDPLKQEQLVADCTTAYQTSEHQSLIAKISEYAYTHPKSLTELAQQFKLSIHRNSTTTPTSVMLNSLNSSDVSEKGFISDALQLENGQIMLLQLLNVTPPHQLDLEQSAQQLNTIYLKHVLIPRLTHELEQCKSTAEIQNIAQQYNLSVIPISAQRPNSKIEKMLFDLTRKKSSPQPSTLITDNSQSIWMRLNEIEYTQSKNPHPTFADEEHIHYIDSIS